MDKVWKLEKCRRRTRIKYWNAVIKTKLTYGLHTMHLTKGQETRLNAFQLKGYRKILKIDTTYINRKNTNKALEENKSKIPKIIVKPQRHF